MRKTIIVSLILVAALGVFFFAPVIEETWGNFGPGDSETVGWVSPSFVLFQCGAYVGRVGIQVPNGGVVNQAGLPFWEASSNWNCQFPHWIGG